MIVLLLALRHKWFQQIGNEDAVRDKMEWFERR